jgi:hypothetical protein
LPKAIAEALAMRAEDSYTRWSEVELDYLYWDGYGRCLILGFSHSAVAFNTRMSILGWRWLKDLIEIWLARNIFSQ